MATLIFIWCRAFFDLNSQYDIYFLCLLLALEVPQYLRILLYITRR